MQMEPIAAGDLGTVSQVQTSDGIQIKVDLDAQGPVGVKYERVFGKWDGEIKTYRTCLSCVEIRTHFGCNGWIFTRIWEDIESNFFPDMKAGGPCMEGLSPEAKRRLFDRRMAWYEAQS